MARRSVKVRLESGSGLKIQSEEKVQLGRWSRLNTPLVDASDAVSSSVAAAAAAGNDDADC